MSVYLGEIAVYLNPEAQGTPPHQCRVVQRCSLCEDVIYVQSNVIGYDHLLEKAIDNKSQAQSYSAEGELLGILYLVKELFGSTIGPATSCGKNEA